MAAVVTNGENANCFIIDDAKQNRVGEPVNQATPDIAFNRSILTGILDDTIDSDVDLRTEFVT